MVETRTISGIGVTCVAARAVLDIRRKETYADSVVSESALKLRLITINLR